MSALRFLVPMLVFSAHAGEFARDPCPPPAPLRAGSAAIFVTFDARSADARRLDGLAKANESKCNRDLPTGSAAEAACAASTAALAGDLASHDTRVGQYQGQVLVLIDQELARIQPRMAQTRTRLAAVAPAAQAWTRDMDKWIETGEEARREAQATAFEKSVGLALEGVKLGLDAQLKLAEADRAHFKSWYAAAAPALTGTTRAALEQRILNLRSGRDVIALLEYIQDQHGRAWSVVRDLQAERGWAASGQAVAGALKLSLTLMKASPGAKLAVDATELMIDSSFGWLAYYSAAQRVEQLAAVQEGQLSAVKALSKLYVEDVDKRKVLVRAKAHLASAACK